MTGATERDADLRELRRMFPSVESVEELRATVRAEYRRDWPRRWKNATEDEAVRFAVAAFAHLLPAKPQNRREGGTE